MAAYIWFGFVLLGLVLYVTLDGFDLGIGILALAQSNDGDRLSLLGLVAPVWDGNESWILLIAVGLWAGFPAATGALLPAVYLAGIVMLFSLIGRGASIEMLQNGARWSRGWLRLFMGGSLVAALSQGVIIGALIQGVALSPHDRYLGGSFNFLTGFSVLTGVTTVSLYVLAGAAMVKMRSSNVELRERLSRWGRPLLLTTATLVALCGVLLPSAGASSMTLSSPLRVDLLVATCVAALCLYFAAWWSFARTDRDNMPFVCVSLTVVVGIIGLMALDSPFIVPPSLTIAAAASPPASLDFLLGGMGLLVPLVIAYNAFAFWTLRPRREPAAASEVSLTSLSSRSRDAARNDG